MHNLPRQILIEIIARYGPAIVDNPRRVEGLLKDLCGDYKPEIKALMDAARAGVVRELRPPLGESEVPPEPLVINLTQQLAEKNMISREDARWAVESWAAALGAAANPESRAVPLHPASLLAKRSHLSLFPAHHPQLSISLAPKVELMLVFVPAGSFLMGGDPAAEKDCPLHQVHLDAFWIGKYPVTNLQYQAFTQASGHPSPQHWKNGAIPTGREQHPVTWVSWEDAGDFCRWASGLPGGRLVRLPGEAEWEKAARGADARIYPWGSAVPDATRCNFNRAMNGTTPVGNYSPRGDSPYGCADMSGNVWEWCSDWYNETYYRDSPFINPPGPESGTYRVLRGGSWGDDHRLARCEHRSWGASGSFGSLLGFRVASPM